MIEIFENGSLKSISPEVMLPRIKYTLFQVYGKDLPIVLKRGWGIDITKTKQLCKNPILFNQLYQLFKSESEHMKTKYDWEIIKRTRRNGQPLLDYANPPRSKVI